MKRSLPFVIVVALAALFFLASAAELQERRSLGTQEQSAASVAATVSVEDTGNSLLATIVLNTHSVPLDEYTFTDIVALRAGGKDHRGRVVSQRGSGHHRSAVVEFDQPGTNEIEVVIKDVASVKERVFRFTR